MNVKFKLEPFTWYAWQMLPGYTDEFYCSPMYIQKIIPKKTGKNLLEVHFINAFYAAGAKGFELEMKVLMRGPGFMILDLLYDERAAVVSSISYSWFSRYGRFMREKEERNNIPKLTHDNVQEFVSGYFTGNPQHHIDEMRAAEAF